MNLHCPDRNQHRANDPIAEQLAVADPAQRTVALLSEGRCPACPTERLSADTMTMYDTEYDVMRCACCDAVWELVGAEYAVLRRGRLVEEVDAAALLDANELADLLGVVPSTLRAMRAQPERHRKIDGLPEPIRVVGKSPVWDRRAVEEWRNE